jgi:enoyl-CoA hydratase/carnithine racemase
MRQSLVENLRTLEYDPKVKVVCIRSLHPKVFCAGANIKEFEHASNAQWIVNDKFKELDLLLRYFNKPIIAAVHKLALGGGFELALHADIILAAESAQFGLPEIKLGLFPGIGGTLVSKTIGK